MERSTRLSVLYFLSVFSTALLGQTTIAWPVVAATLAATLTGGVFLCDIFSVRMIAAEADQRLGIYRNGKPYGFWEEQAKQILEGDLIVEIVGKPEYD